MELSASELKEVLTIFKAESREHITLLNKGLLELEKNPSNKKNLEEIFRTAHSIKGAARMLGLTPIESIAHELEDALGLVKNNKLDVSNHMDLLYESVDFIEQVINELSNSDNPDLSSINVAGIVFELKKLLGKVEDLRKGPETKKIEKKEQISVVDEENSDVNKMHPDAVSDLELEKNLKADLDAVEEKIDRKDSAPHVKTDISKDSDEFIRIAVTHIDRIMNRVGELISTKVKSAQQLNTLQLLNTRIFKNYKEFELYQNFITSIESSMNKATEALDVSEFSEKEFRVVFRLLINARILVNKLYHEMNDIVQNQIDDNSKTTNLINSLQEDIRDIRLLPLNSLLELMPRMVRDIAKNKKKKVELEIIGGETKIDKKILEELKDPFIHLLRNCIDHGIEDPDERVVHEKASTGKIQIKARYEGNTVLIEISDDGKGIDKKKVLKKALDKGIIDKEHSEKLTESEILNMIFIPGFSTSDIITDLSGRGVGMDVVRTNIEKLKGVINIQSTDNIGTKFTIRLPLTLATLHVLIIESNKEKYTFPVISVFRLIHITMDEIETLDAKEFIKVDSQFINLVKLDDVLGNPKRLRLKSRNESLIKIDDEDKKKKIPVIICASAEKKIALIVDKLIDEQEVVIKDLGTQFKRIRHVMGATILGTGELAMMLDPADLIKSVIQTKYKTSIVKKEVVEQGKRRVLVVDDSITTRTLEKNILEQAGYDVTIAVNGLEAWNILKEKRDFEILVSDVEMPYMTGFELVAKVKNDPTMQDLPCILCTSLESETDKRKGIDAGANAYITKGTFNQRTLLDTIERLI